MKKIGWLFLSLLAPFFVSKAQGSFETSIKFDKSQVPSVAVVLNMEQEIAEGALQKRFEEQMRLKGSSEKGFRVYKSQNVPEFGPSTYDVYTKVDKEGKKNRTRAVVSILVSLGNENFLSSTNAPDVIENVQSFLNDFIVFANDYNRREQINANNKELEKLQKQQEKELKKRDEFTEKIQNREKQMDILRQNNSALQGN